MRNLYMCMRLRTCSQCLLRIPGFLKPWMSGMYGLKFSIFSFTSMATSWQAGISLKCLTHLKTVLNALFTFCSSCSASIVVRGSFIQLSYHFCQSEAVNHMFLNGSKSLINRPSLSYCWEFMIKVIHKWDYKTFHFPSNSIVLNTVRVSICSQLASLNF